MKFSIWILVSGLMLSSCGTATVVHRGKRSEVPVGNLPGAIAKNYVGGALGIVGAVIHIATEVVLLPVRVVGKGEVANKLGKPTHKVGKYLLDGGRKYHNESLRLLSDEDFAAIQRKPEYKPVTIQVRGTNGEQRTIHGSDCEQNVTTGEKVCRRAVFLT